MQAEASEILSAIRADIEQAADAMLAAAERGLSDLAEARQGEPAAFDKIERMFLAILEACAFQDLAGQRLSKLEALVDGLDLSPAGEADSLLNGPALPGQGLDQDAADALFASPPS